MPKQPSRTAASEYTRKRTNTHPRSEGRREGGRERRAGQAVARSLRAYSCWLLVLYARVLQFIRSLVSPLLVLLLLLLCDFICCSQAPPPRSSKLR